MNNEEPYNKTQIKIGNRNKVIKKVVINGLNKLNSQIKYTTFDSIWLHTFNKLDKSLLRLFKLPTQSKLKTDALFKKETFKV